MKLIYSNTFYFVEFSIRLIIFNVYSRRIVIGLGAKLKLNEIAEFFGYTKKNKATVAVLMYKTYKDGDTEFSKKLPRTQKVAMNLE
jgi:hypothetical protein